MREIEILSEYHAFFVEYVELLNRHKRLVKVEVDEIRETTADTFRELKEHENVYVRFYGIVFEALLRAIETNNEAEGLTQHNQHKVNQRISYTFRLLRILTKEKEMVEWEEMYGATK